jgi:hypothetical protein
MMTVVVYNIVKAPMGWAVFCDGVKLGGICGSKEAALEATTVAAAFVLRDGGGVQINAPDSAGSDEIPLRCVEALEPLKVQKRANARAADIAPTIKALREAGATSLRAIANGLNERNIPTARGSGQ